ncbi:MAG: hypothetical protein JW715_10125 [Sedimentisphaerales bacterium]|nr:hypothetical protein [Sedimentisphaerales bacterium]
MSKQKIHKPRRRPAANVQKSKSIETLSPAEIEQMHGRERYFDIFLVAAFILFGVYQSVIYFGHKIVPISDFPDIVRIGHELLSFKVPSRFMQAPVVGFLQASLSYIVGGNHPDLTAGWLLNAILHPLNLVLLYLIGRKIVGRAAIWFAIIAILNYWVIYMLTEPIIETSLMFFILLTFYLIFMRSSWCFVAASVATMVRYEGAALILAAFVMDMIYRRSRPQRIRAFVYSALATVPLIIWLIGLLLNWDPEKGNYLAVFTKNYAASFTESVEDRTGIIMHMRLLWSVGFYPLFRANGAEAARILFGFSKIIAGLGFASGVFYGLWKRQWQILALLIFFVPYFILHARYPYPLQRFHTTIFWIALLICLLGLQGIWKIVDGNGRIPRVIVIILQAVFGLFCLIWLFLLVPGMIKISEVSPKSAFLPWIAMLLGGLIFAARIYIYRARFLARELCILAFFCLVIVSNQFALVGRVGDGQGDKEFRQLADWYIDNAQPGEKMGVYMYQVVGIYAQKYADDIVGLPQADSPAEFTKACYEQNITYVVWATREGSNPRFSDRYRRLGLDKNIAQLANPKDAPPYLFVGQVGWKRGYVNIFRLLRPEDIINSARSGN